ncbi:hypothetical protein [Corallococcus terminator]|uniref:Uncharacterized protein n=1 Tax=Corallococcus terminator TaxID=2316733 RepID=A0A3A8IP15_9BACT|nr:hypothetical protein [Corallococcus terminator]RKG85122.1 hypothetical protein D7V88_20535 [Corallococcus terminator]
MNSLSMSIHDAEVVGIRSNRDAETLTFDLVLENKRALLLEFKGALHWDLERYVTQNVLYGIDEWRGDQESTLQVCAEIGLDAFWVEKIKAGEFTVFEIDPAVGMRGYVIARTMEVRIAPVLPATR